MPLYRQRCVLGSLEHFHRASLGEDSFRIA